MLLVHVYTVLASMVLNRLNSKTVKRCVFEPRFCILFETVAVSLKEQGFKSFSTPSAAGTLQAVCVGKTLSHTAAQWRQPVSLWGIKALAT